MNCKKPMLIALSVMTALPYILTAFADDVFQDLIDAKTATLLLSEDNFNDENRMSQNMIKTDYCQTLRVL